MIAVREFARLGQTYSKSLPSKGSLDEEFVAKVL